MAKITLDAYSESGSRSISTTCIYQAPIVRKVDNAIHRTKIYPLDNAIGFANTYLLDSDYPVDSAIQRLNNQGQVLTKICLPGNKTAPFDATLNNSTAI